MARGGSRRGEKNPICAQADQHDSSGWNLRPKCLPKRKRCSSIVSMEDKGASARIAGAAAFVSMEDKGARARIAGAAASVSMEDKGTSARIAGAAAAMRFHRQARQGQGLVFTTTFQDSYKLLLPSCSRYHRRDGPRSVVQPPSYPVAFHSTALRESCNQPSRIPQSRSTT